jgi:hypothetical protein
MRDIREDLQDRANFLKSQMDAAQAQFEKSVERIKHDHTSMLEGLKADLAAVNKLMGAEQRRLADTPPIPKAPAQPQPQPQAQAQPHAQEPQPPKARPRMPLAEMIGLQRAS